MVAIFALLFYASGAALVCFGVYEALHWLFRACRVAFYVLAVVGLSVHLFVLALMGLLCLAPLNFDPDVISHPSSSPTFDWYALGFVLLALSTWGASMVGGTITLRRVTQGQMTRSGAFLFCPVYWVVSFVLIGIASMPFSRNIEQYLNELHHLSPLLRIQIWPAALLNVLMYTEALLMWLFPLGVPLSLLAVAHLRHLSRDTVSGSLV